MRETGRHRSFRIRSCCRAGVCRAFTGVAVVGVLFLVNPVQGRVFAGPVCRAGNDSSPGFSGGGSVERRLEVISLPGAGLPGLCNREIEGIRVSTFQGETLRPIPFQVDEYDAEGRLVLTGGEQAAPDPESRFDENDSLMFLARDLGPRAPSAWPGAADSLTWEIHVTDPVDDSQGWAYVSFSCTPPPLSAKTYVRYTLKEGEVDDVDTSYYSIRYPWGAYYADRMVLYPASGGAGTDFLDRLKTRGTFCLFFSLLKVHITEEKMSAKVVGYRNGPIRLVRRLNYWADLGLGLRSPKFEADIFYYDTFLNAPVTTHIPVSLDLFFSEAYGEIGTDYNQKAYGMIFKNSNNPEGTILDGRMSPQEERLDLSMDDWRLVTGSQGTFFRGKIPENEITPQVKMTLDYVDDISRNDPPECEAGQVGHVFDRMDVLKVKPGVYKTDIVFLIPPEYRPGDEALYLQWENNPLKVDVERINPGGLLSAPVVSKTP